MATTAPPTSANPLAGLYEFTRAHLLVANNIALAAATLVAVLDFLAPRLSVAPLVVYSATAALLSLMVVAAIAPALVGGLISAMGYAASRADAPLWRKPLWQFSVAILFGVSVVGFASVARAGQGGLIAASFPAARTLQESMLGLRRDVADIRTGVAAANAKLDGIAERSYDPQRDLASLGYSYDDHGLTQAIQQGDPRAIGIFAKAGYKAQGRVPMLNILNGGQAWSSQAVAMLPRSMFGSRESCDHAGLLRERLREPAAQRLAAYERLCGSRRTG